MSDLISRQEAIRWVKQECNPYGKPTIDFESGKRVMEHLEQMPSAEPKTGEWIYNTNNESVSEIWNCSECDQWSFAKTNFCPNCGARMLGEDGEE